MRAFIISGTDTGIGKTIVAAMLTIALGAHYWKPIQSGIEDGTDTQRVQALTGLSNNRFLRESYILSRPLSPHRAAELDGTEIGKIFLPKMGGTLIIEGVGGLMVPVTRRKLQIDVFKEWAMPVILCASTKLGTINHTLLSIEALHKRKIVLHGLIFIGQDAGTVGQLYLDGDDHLLHPAGADGQVRLLLAGSSIGIGHFS